MFEIPWTSGLNRLNYSSRETLKLYGVPVSEPISKDHRKELGTEMSRQSQNKSLLLMFIYCPIKSKLDLMSLISLCFVSFYELEEFYFTFT